MAWTYTEGSTADADRVRFELGDTDEARPLFSDAEISDLLVQDTAVLSAAAHACRIMSRRTAGDFDFEADGHSFKKSSVSAMWAKRAQELTTEARGTTVVMPRRVDGYSDDIDSDEVTTWDRS